MGTACVPLTSDVDLTTAHIGGLASPDAISAFLTELGYPTARRQEVPPTSLGLSMETTESIRRMELLAEDDEQFFRVLFVQLRSITAKARNELARNLGAGIADHLIILTKDFEEIEFVLIDKATRRGHSPAKVASPKGIPIPWAVTRKAATQLDVRILRRFTWTCKDGLDQFSKLRSVFEAAHYSGQYFQNRALFADHYLETRLREEPAWRDNPSEVFATVRDLFNRTRSAVAGESEAITRTKLFEPLWDLLGFKASVVDGPDHLSPTYWLHGPDGLPLTAAFCYRWERWLDGPDLNDPDAPDANPGAAVVSALADGKARWVIVTNGKHWRLYSRDAHSRSTNFYEVDLEEALRGSGETDPNEAFRYWWLFFRRQAFEPVPQSEPPECWLDSIVRGSREYAKRLGDQLKDRVFGVSNRARPEPGIFAHLAAGFLLDRRTRLGVQQAPTDEELRDTFEATLTLLYRLLFLLYAEARHLLPIREAAYKAASLKQIKEEIAGHAGGVESEAAARLGAYPDSQSTIYDRLTSLFAVMDQGDPALNVPCYNGGLFHAEVVQPDEDESREHRIARYLLEHKVPDRHLAVAIDRLSRDVDERTFALAFIDYKSLEVRHLGSIYEGLLEFRLRIAEEDLGITTEKKAEKYIPLSKLRAERPAARGGGRRKRNASGADAGPAPAVRKGEVYLANDKAERKATGSYYTPDPIVEYIVEHTVGPVLAEKLEALRPELNAAGKTYHRHAANAKHNPGMVRGLTSATSAAEIERLIRAHAAEKTYDDHKDLVDRVFDLKVLDPAMGSGHFLVEAVDFITDRLLDFLNRFPHNPVQFALEKTRNSILAALGEQGVTVRPEELTEINLLKRHVLKRCIYGVDLNPMAVELAKVSLWLDAFTLGAPLSFLDHHLRCGNSVVGESRVSQHILTGSQREEELCRTVRNMLTIAATADANPADVNASKSLFAEVEQLARPFKNRLNIETARTFLKFDSAMHANMTQYPFDRAFDAGKVPPGLRRSADMYLKTVELAEQLRFFHWEIDFPEVYFGFADLNRRQIRHRNQVSAGSAGFDAIIGNPPYVRQEAIKALKPYLKTSYLTYDSANDLYIYFLELELRNLRAGGRMGMIVANKWMRAGYGRTARSFLRRTGQPIELIDFGHTPIFPDADTFPCIPIVARRSTALPLEAELPKTETMLACRIPRSDWHETMNLGGFVQARSYRVSTSLMRDDGWTVDDPREQRLMERIRNGGIPLKDILGDVPRRGIVSGLNEAFYIDNATRNALIAEDPRSGELILPLLRGRHIARWITRPTRDYILMVRRGTSIQRYPAIHKHLLQFKDRLEPRPDNWDEKKHGKWKGRAAGDYEWFELQGSPGEEFVELIRSPKIIYQEIQYHSWFALDASGACINNKAFFLPTDNLALLGVLSSPLMWWVLTRALPHMKDEALSPAGYLMENLRIELGASDQQRMLVNLVSSLIDQARQIQCFEVKTVEAAQHELQAKDADERVVHWLALPPDAFAARVRRLPGARPEAGIAFQRKARVNQVRLLQAQRALEQQLAKAVEDIYGLTAEERCLLRATRPVRDPLDVLDGLIEGKIEAADTPKEVIEESVSY